MANFFGIFVVTLVTVWTVLNKPGEVQGQLSPCSASEQQQCGNTQFPTGELPCFSNGAGPNSFICNCGGSSSFPFNVGRLCTTPVPQSVACTVVTSLETCYGCAQNFFTSINYPGMYDSGRVDVYLLYVPGALEINFEFCAPFSVETKKDDLFVGAGLEFSADDVAPRPSPGVISSNRLYYFDNRIITPPGQNDPIPGATPDPFTIIGDTAWVYFKTDRNCEGVGFKLTWSFVAADNIPPFIVCPTLVLVESFPGNIGQFADWTTTCTDSEDGVITTTVCNPAPGFFFFGLGTNTVTCTCTDSAGEFSQCDFPVTVAGINSPPVITCPAPVVVTSLANNIGNFATWDTPTCMDAEDGIITTSVCVLASESFFPGVGVNIVTCTCTNSGGLSDECTFSVTVEGFNTTPLITCPAPVVVTSLANNIGNFVIWAPPTCVDSEDGAITTTVCSPESGSFFTGVDVTTVTCTCTDSVGSSDECTFPVTVQGFISPPVITCPRPVFVTFLANNVGNFATWDPPTCVDAEDGTITTSSCAPETGSFFTDVGVNIVTCTCTDSGGESDECVFPVIGEGFNSPPVITCPAPVLVTSLASNVGNSATWDPPFCFDAEDGTITTSVCIPASGSFFSGVGVNTLTCTCTDSGGLSDECTFLVTVQGVNTPPLITCPALVVVTSLATNVGNFATWDSPTCVDAEDGTIITSVCDPETGSFFTGVGVNTGTCTCTDSGGVSNECDFSVIVEGFNSPPVITCPAPVLVTSLANNVGNSATWDPPTCVDAEDGTITTSVCVPASGTFFSGVGVNTVTCTCTGSGGLSDECIFPVTLQGVNTPPLITCPPLVVVTSLASNVGATVTWDPPTCFDAEDLTIATSVCTPGTGSFFTGVGVNTVTCTCTDSGGVSNECDFSVVIEGFNSSPLITCPAPVVVTALANNVGNSVTWDTLTCDDAEDGTIATSVCVPASGSFFPSGGVNTVICTCTDSGGLSDECTFPVTVQGVNTPPLITCPAPVFVTSLANNIGNFAAWDPPTCVDGEDGTITTSVCAPESGSFFIGGGGVNTVTCTCTDSGGLSNECDFPVIVEGFNTPPVITCPAPVVVTSLANNVGNSATWDPPSCVDAEDGTITTSVCVLVSGSFFPGVGVNTVTCTCTNSGGLFDECTFPVTVQDFNSPPVITCPAPVIVTSLANNVGNSATWDSPFCVDAEDGTITLSSCAPSSGSFLSGVGVNIITCTCTDSGGVSDECTFPVTVQAFNSPPVITCPAPMVVTSLANNVGNTVTWNPPTCVDAEDGFVTTSVCVPALGSFFSGVGLNTVTCTCTDSGALSVECTFAVTLQGANTPPLITCPTPVIVTSLANNVGNPATWDPPTCLDGEDGTITTSVCVPVPGSFFSGVGVNTVTCTCTDSGGLSDECTFPVIVEGFNTPPLITCPAPAVVTSLTNNVGSSVIWDSPACLDAEDGTITTSVCVPVSGSFFPGVGVNTVTCTCTDSGGLSDECLFQVTVEGFNSPPVITCPAPVVVTSLANNVGNSAAWNPPTCVDAEDGTITTSVCVPASGSFFPFLGLNTVTCTCTDNGGLSDECIFPVTVEAFNSPPVITCSAPVVVTSLANNVGNTATWNPPTCVDAEDGTITISACVPISGSFFSGVGVNTVSCTCTDSGGLFNDCAFSVTVEGVNSPPVITCPVPVVVISLANNVGNFATWDPPSCVDTEDGTIITSVCAPLSGSFLPDIGVNTVTCTCSDSGGLSDECAFPVTLQAFNSPPVITCPAPMVVTSLANNVGNSVTWNPPNCVDAEDETITTSVCVPASGSFFSGVGINTVTCTCTDSGALSDECFFPVTVQGVNTPPLITCPAPVVVTSLASNVGATITWDPPTCVDQEDRTITTSSCVPESGSFFTDLGVNIVICTCTDNGGLSDECTFPVIVEGFISPPVITCPAPVVVASLTNNVGSSFTWDPPSCVDAEDGAIATSVCVPVSGSFFPGVGVNTVTCTCTDSSGLSDECAFLVTVEGFNSPPVITCPAPVVVTSLANNLGNSATWDPPTCFDAEDGTITLSVCAPASRSFFPFLGLNTVTCTCTDSGGLSDECTFPVTVQAFNSPPVITCPAPMVVTSLANNVGNTATWNPPICFDAEDGTITTSVCAPVSGSFFPGVGVTTASCTCTDSGGLSDECVFTVTAEGVNTTPVITCPAPVVVTSLLNNVGNFATWDPPTCVDAEDGTITTSTCVPPFGLFFSDVGANTVTCTCSDSGGLSDECTFPVVVQAFNSPPVITCPVPVVMISLSNNVGNAVTWNPPTCVDTEDGTITISVCAPVSGSFFPGVGVNSASCTCTDSGGLSDECTFLVSITGFNTPPVITCPNPVVLTSLANNVGASATWSPVTCVDGEDGAITTSVCTSASGSFFSGVGVNTVTCTCTDSGGLSDECTFPVAIQAFNSPPVITCQAAVVVTSLSNNVGNTATWNPLTCVDAEDGTITTSVCVPASGSFFSVVGVNTVTCTCTDSGALSDECTLSVTVQAFNSVPVITCPAAVAVTSLANNGGNSATWNQPTCVDEEDGTITTSVCVPASGSFFSGVGINTVACTCTDSGGRSDECTFSVTVEEDTDPPMLLCPGNVVLTVLNGVNSVPIQWSLPIVSDISEPVRLVSASHNPGDEFPVGTTTVRYEYADAFGNAASCTFDIRIMIEFLCVVNPCNNGGTCVTVDLDSTSCVCPRCFTGDFCETAVDVCSGNMCAFGSTCVPVPGSCEQYTCNCPPCFTGPFCNTGGDVCAGNECRNGGVCQADPTDCTRYTCICPACFSGPFCQMRANGCSLNPCLNNAVCTDLSASECNAYRCDCVGCFHGFNCEREANGCSPNPCQNNAVCTDLSATECNTYRCDCVGCFDGFNCEIAIPNPCNQNPCLNGGTCTRNLQFCASYTCRCTPGFDGDNCQTGSVIRVNPCNSFPCENGGSCCSQESDSNYVCVCPQGYAGINCGMIAAPGANLCLGNPCENGGSCFASYYSGSSSFMYTPQYMCLCAAGFTGNNCQLNVFAVPSQDMCSMEPGVCQNGGTCTNTFNSFTGDVDFKCTNCPAFAIGKTCEVIVPDACISSPCLNSGTCVTQSGGFRCICNSAFQGIFCQIPGLDFQPPVISSCPDDFSQMGPSPVIFTPPQATDNSGYVRLLFLSHTPGQVFPIGITAVSYVFGDAAGNQNQCTFYVTITDGGLPFYIVISNCPGNIVSQTSGSSANVMFGTPDAVSRDGGVFLVRQSHTSGSSFPVGTTTPVSFVFRDVAGNQAECNFDVTVMTADDCFRVCNLQFNPVCGSDGVTYGNLCEFEVAQCRDPLLTFTQGACINDPCSTSPCLGGGACFTTGTGNGFLCLCTPGRSGDRCEIVIDGPCSPSPCENDGTCLAGMNTFFCLCLAGFTGAVCEQDVDPCDPNPCLGGGSCFLAQDRSIRCACLPGRTGQLCENTVIDDPCSPSPCENDGTCLPGMNIFFCLCLPGFTGAVCEQGLTVDSALCQDRTLAISPQSIFVQEIIVVPNATFNGVIVPPTSFGGRATSLTTTTYILTEGVSRFIYNYEFAGLTATCNFTIFVTGSSQVGKRSVDETEMFPEEVSLCDPNPCLNEGQCYLLMNEETTTLAPYCQCVKGWTGPTCATSMSYVSQFHETVQMWTLLVILVVVVLTFALMVCQYQRRTFQGLRYQDEKALI